MSYGIQLSVHSVDPLDWGLLCENGCGEGKVVNVGGGYEEIQGVSRNILFTV